MIWIERGLQCDLVPTILPLAGASRPGCLKPGTAWHRTLPGNPEFLWATHYCASPPSQKKVFLITMFYLKITLEHNISENRYVSYCANACTEHELHCRFGFFYSLYFLQQIYFTIHFTFSYKLHCYCFINSYIKLYFIMLLYFTLFFYT